MMKSYRITLTEDQAETLRGTLEWVIEKSPYGMTIEENEYMRALIRQINTKLGYSHDA